MAISWIKSCASSPRTELAAHASSTTGISALKIEEPIMRTEALLRESGEVGTHNRERDRDRERQREIHESDLTVQILQWHTSQGCACDLR